MGGIEPQPHDAVTVGVLAQHAVEQALLRGVRQAASVRGAPAVRSYGGSPRS
jgi:hypothetical protein